MMLLVGHPVGDIIDLIGAFNDKGVDDINEMIRLTQDFDSTALEYRAQAMSAEAKLNRIKTFLKD